jgi:sugar transferase (PEP-CTERM/EpsH1 system associated)
MRRWVNETLCRYDIKDAFVFCSSMAPYLFKHRRRLRIILDLVDVDSEKWRAYAQSAGWPLNKIYCMEQRRLFDLERRAARHCDRVLFVSRAEANVFERLAPECSDHVECLINGVDLRRFDPAQEWNNPFSAESIPIVFTGAMGYKPNADAVVWFAREVFPAVRVAHPKAEFWIVGSNPAPRVGRLARTPGIKVVGKVADVRPYLSNASCIVAPLQIARGVQNKVLEAMAMAKAIVLTPQALEGLHATPGEELLVAANASEFVDHVCAVISCAHGEMLQRGRKRVELDHDWSVNLSLLDGLFANESPLEGGMPHTRRGSPVRNGTSL